MFISMQAQKMLCPFLWTETSRRRLIMVPNLTTGHSGKRKINTREDPFEDVKYKCRFKV